MEVNNGIIIDGVLHEYAEVEHLSCKQQCANCSLCDLCKNEFKDPICNLFLYSMGIFVNRGKVKVEKEEME